MSDPEAFVSKVDGKEKFGKRSTGVMLIASFKVWKASYATGVQSKCSFVRR